MYISVSEFTMTFTWTENVEKSFYHGGEFSGYQQKWVTYQLLTSSLWTPLLPEAVFHSVKSPPWYAGAINQSVSQSLWRDQSVSQLVSRSLVHDQLISQPITHPQSVDQSVNQSITHPQSIDQSTNHSITHPQLINWSRSQSITHLPLNTITWIWHHICGRDETGSGGQEFQGVSCLLDLGHAFGIEFLDSSTHWYRLPALLF